MKKGKKKTSAKRIIFLAFAIFIILILLLFGAKIYLYIRTLAGNDLVIKISVSKENIFINSGDSEKITITNYALANLFCNTECSSELVDLSEGKLIQKEYFRVKLPRSKDYILNAPKYGEGQKLYKYQTKCSSIKSFLCETKSENQINTILITLNYEPSPEEQNMREELKSKIEQYYNKNNYYSYFLNDFESVFNEINISESENIKNTIKNSNALVESNNNSLQEIINLWPNADYNLAYSSYYKAENSFFISDYEFNELNLSVHSYVSMYNGLLENISQIKNKLILMKNLNLSENSSGELQLLISEFNSLAFNFTQKESIEFKEEVVLKFIEKVNLFNPDIIGEQKIRINNAIYDFNLKKIILKNITISEFQLPVPPIQCCLNKICRPCCNNVFSNDSSKYPLVFIHGHSFSKHASAETSLDAFTQIQESIGDDYINAGSLLLSPYDKSLEGVWGKTSYPVTVKISYYFDLLNKAGKSSLIETKTDNLDTYTIRLRDIIKAIKYKTNKEKVNLIGHSMGGLIIRRYMQVFGEEDINKVVLIGVPNNGISEKTMKYCAYFGTELECRDMSESGLFINKLNSAPPISVPVYNIIGIGCDTDGETGDGVVKNSSQYLAGANNYYINGTCLNSEFKYLHTEILKTDQYPEVLKIIKKVLSDN